MELELIKPGSLIFVSNGRPQPPFKIAAIFTVANSTKIYALVWSANRVIEANSAAYSSFERGAEKIGDVMPLGSVLPKLARLEDLFCVIAFSDEVSHFLSISTLEAAISKDLRTISAADKSEWATSARAAERA